MKRAAYSASATEETTTGIMELKAWQGLLGTAEVGDRARLKMPPATDLDCGRERYDTSDWISRRIVHAWKTSWLSGYRAL